MKQGTKIFAGTILLVISCIAGCIFLMKGCMAKYDEYYQLDKAYGFNSQQGKVIVFLKEHYKVTSYSSGGGMTHINGYPIYFLETRDAATLKLLKSTKFDDLDDYTKSRPHIVGHDDNTIWVYQDKIMAFNPFTHEKVCTKEKLEELNSAFKNNLPDDIKYYTYNYILGRLEITTKDAIHYQISKSFKAQKISESNADESEEIAALKTLKKEVEAEQAEKKKKLTSSDREYWTLNDTVRKIESIIDKKKEEFRNNKEYNQKIQESRAKGFSYAYDKLANAVILDSTIYALLGEKDLKENNGYFYFRKIYTDDVQRSLYQTGYKELQKNSGFYSSCKVLEWKPINNNISFLKGGFLEDKENLKTIELGNPKSWLILSAKEVGDKSKLILQRVNVQGIQMWTKELPIIDFSDMVLAGENLVISSIDGVKNTDKSECNWIISVNLKTGDFILLDLATEKE